MQDKIKVAAYKYRHARRCLGTTRGEFNDESAHAGDNGSPPSTDVTAVDSATTAIKLDWRRRLRPLRTEDLVPPRVFEIDHVHGDYSGKRGMKMAELAKLVGDGYREIPWIWRMAGPGDGKDTELNAGIRVEWAKGCARALRWKEEVRRVKEEMRCVRRSLEKREQRWLSQARGWEGLGVADAEGIRAYGHRQASVNRRLREYFTELWDTPFPNKRGKLSARSAHAVAAAEAEWTREGCVWTGATPFGSSTATHGTPEGPKTTTPPDPNPVDPTDANKVLEYGSIVF
ncbi:hypothetical protein HGRIS_014201 [Hohenbuehelia grisea]|uniref:Uncharacterized protein n=1 Tax=Hohenbuehelia grisea TaxID=104357 RepID=A0ABR3JUM8_9AGAR